MTMLRSLARPRRAAGALAVVLVALAALSQALLPSLAAKRVNSRLSGFSQGVSVHIEALPAVKLLLGKADNVRLQARSVSPPTDRSWLKELQDTKRFSAQIGEVKSGPAPLRDVRATKRADNAFRMEGTLKREDLVSALPPGVRLSSRKGAPNEIPVRLGSGLLGKGLEGMLEIRAQDGSALLRVHLPGALGLIPLNEIVLFHDSHLFIRRLDLLPDAGDWNVRLDGTID